MSTICGKMFKDVKDIKMETLKCVRKVSKCFLLGKTFISNVRLKKGENSDIFKKHRHAWFQIIT